MKKVISGIWVKRKVFKDNGKLTVKQTKLLRIQ